MTTKEVWAKYSIELKQFIISKVEDTTIADDILQETFLKIHSKLSSLKDIKKLKSWCFSIARNTILDYWKSTNKTFEISDVDLKSEIKTDHHTEEDCLKGILKNLPKKYRDPLFLSDIKGLKQQEVANQLNQTLSSTKSQIQRARKLIAKGFMDCCGFKMDAKGNLIGEIQDREDCKVCK